MTQRITVNAEEMITETLPDAGVVHRSSDYDSGGVTVREGAAGFNRQVHSVTDLNDNDIVVVDNMEVTAKMARELGLLGQVFDEQLGPQSGRVRTEEVKPVVVVKTGYELYDTTSERLAEQTESGVINTHEAQVYDTAVAELAMTGLGVDTIVGVSNGDIREGELTTEMQATATRIENNVREASTKAAMSELGKPAFDALSNLAAANPEVGVIVERYAIDRAQGKAAGVTWAALYHSLLEDLGLS